MHNLSGQFLCSVYVLHFALFFYKKKSEFDHDFDRVMIVVFMNGMTIHTVSITLT